MAFAERPKAPTQGAPGPREQNSISRVMPVKSSQALCDVRAGFVRAVAALYSHLQQ
jgi:hypothetical protein